jgi:hypothetical protein
MAETSYLWDNPGTGDSPALGYGHTEFMTEMFRMLWNGTGNRGVLQGWLNELEVTDGGGLNAAVDTGGAVVYGFGYENTTAVNVAMPNNAVNHVVARCSWAAQTVRLTQVAALVQNPGVTYDIPLATVTTVAGAITLITDTREFCEFTTDLIDGIVEAAHIQADAVTTAKLENQTRWVVRGAGELEPDATNPATWSNTSPAGYLREHWSLAHNQTHTLWCTFRVPADISSATMTIYFWNVLESAAASGDIRWVWSSWDAQPSAVLANQTNGVTVSQTGRDFSDGAYRDNMGTITVTAGDIVHVEIYRDGTVGADTEINPAMLFAVEFEYTADS